MKTNKILIFSILIITLIIIGIKIPKKEIPIIKNPNNINNNEFYCQQNSDCHIVSIYNPEVSTIKTKIACKNKDFPLNNKTDHIQNHTQYIIDTCTCKNNQCIFQN